MNVQRATRLGLYAVLELADQPGRQLLRSEIAGKFGVSSNHLSKVMMELRKAGLVEAVRGVGGGYTFTGNARHTTLMDIIEIFEPSILQSAGEHEPGGDSDIGATLNLVLQEINETIHATLNSISIQTLLQIKNRAARQAAVQAGAPPASAA